MSESSSESEEEDNYFMRKLYALRLVMKLVDRTLTLEDTKPLIDEAVALLKSTTDYGTKEVENILDMLQFVAYFLMDDVQKFLNDSFVDEDTIQFRTRRYEVTQYLIQQDFPSIAVKMFKSLYEQLRSAAINKSDQSVDQFGRNMNALCSLFHNHTDNYPMPSAPLCRSLCKEGTIEILESSLLYFDDPGSDIPHKAELFLDMKRSILGVLSNIITECPDYRDRYRRANIVDAIAKIKKTNVEIKALSLLVLAYIVDERENDLIIISHDSIQFLTELFVKSAFSVKHMVDSSDLDQGTHIRYTCRELIGGINHLAVHDTNKDAFVKHGCVPAMIRMLQSDFSEDEKQLAAEALGTLALKDDIKENPEIQQAMSGKK